MGAGEFNGFYDGRRWIFHVTIFCVRNIFYIVWWTPALAEEFSATANFGAHTPFDFSMNSVDFEIRITMEQM